MALHLLEHPAYTALGAVSDAADLFLVADASNANAVRSITAAEIGGVPATGIVNVPPTGMAVGAVNVQTAIDDLQSQLTAAGTITGQYVGSAATFAGLPTTDAAGDAASNGDWAILTTDVVGTGTAAAPQFPSGMYVTNGTVYTLAMEISDPIAIGTAVALAPTAAGTVGASSFASPVDHTHPFQTAAQTPSTAVAGVTATDVDTAISQIAALAQTDQTLQATTTAGNVTTDAIEITATASGIILRAPNGTDRFRYTASASGALEVNAA